MRKHKFAIWALIFFMPTFVFILCPAAYVFLVDPLWQWDHPWHLKRWHRSFNERLQKTNYLASHRVNIDTLIIGTSKSTYISPAMWSDSSGFNYGVSSGKPSEYPDYINYARERASSDVKVVLLEFSFFQVLQVENTFELPSTYIQNAKDWSKRFRSLFSRDAYTRAKSTNRIPQSKCYFVKGNHIDSFKVPQVTILSKQEKLKAIDSDVKTYKKRVYNMPYDNMFAQHLSAIHDAVGRTNFIVYTMPDTKHLMKLLYELGRFDAYEQWLRNLVAEFGIVYHFMYPNNISMNDDNFYDAMHPVPDTLNKMMKIIRKLRVSGIGENTKYGGVVLTPENIDYWIGVFHREFAAL